MTQRFFGKYRGKVENNIDPLFLGRVQVSVPAVLGQTSLGWAMPCSPYAGNQVGLFTVPPHGANIWVEFEGGDVDYPIWSGCFWGTGEVPASPALAEMKVLKTDTTTLTISDLPGAGGVTLEVSPPAVAVAMTLKLDSQGIEITIAQSTLKLTTAAIESTISGSSVKLDPAQIALAAGPAKCTIAAANGVETSFPPAKLALSASGIDISNGGASVKLSPASVQVNNGALEVI